MPRNFGIEIECIGLTESRAVNVLLAAGINTSPDTEYRHYDYSKWKVIHDRSINSSTGGCEVVSPILNGDEGFEEIKRVCKALSDAGATVNKTCGLHVHVDASELTGPWVRSIVNRYSKFETTIDSFMPLSRRARNNSQYCDTLSTMIANLESGYPTSWNSDSVSIVCSASHDRFRKINLTAYQKYKTIEFRHHSGSVNGSKIINWVQFVLAFVDASKPVEVAPVSLSSNVLPIAPRRRGRPCRASINATQVAAMTVAPTNTTVTANEWALSNRKARKMYVHLAQNVGMYISKRDLANIAGIDVDSVAAYVSQIRSTLGVEIKNSRYYGYKLISTNVTLPTTTLSVPVQQSPLVSVAPVENDVWTRGIPPHLVSYYIERAMELNAER